MSERWNPDVDGSPQSFHRDGGVLYDSPMSGNSRKQAVVLRPRPNAAGASGHFERHPSGSSRGVGALGRGDGQSDVVEEVIEDSSDGGRDNGRERGTRRSASRSLDRWAPPPEEDLGDGAPPPEEDGSRQKADKGLKRTRNALGVVSAPSSASGDLDGMDGDPPSSSRRGREDTPESRERGRGERDLRGRREKDSKEEDGGRKRSGKRRSSSRDRERNRERGRSRSRSHERDRERRHGGREREREREKERDSRDKGRRIPRDEMPRYAPPHEREREREKRQTDVGDGVDGHGGRERERDGGERGRSERDRDRERERDSRNGRRERDRGGRDEYSGAPGDAQADGPAPMRRPLILRPRATGDEEDGGGPPGGPGPERGDGFERDRDRGRSWSRDRDRDRGTRWDRGAPRRDGGEEWEQQRGGGGYRDRDRDRDRERERGGPQGERGPRGRRPLLLQRQSSFDLSDDGRSQDLSPRGGQRGGPVEPGGFPGPGPGFPGGPPQFAPDFRPPFMQPPHHFQQPYPPHGGMPRPPFPPYNNQWPPPEHFYPHQQNPYGPPPQQQWGPGPGNHQGPQRSTSPPPPQEGQETGGDGEEDPDETEGMTRFVPSFRRAPQQFDSPPGDQGGASPLPQPETGEGRGENGDVQKSTQETADPSAGDGGDDEEDAEPALSFVPRAVREEQLKLQVSQADSSAEQTAAAQQDSVDPQKRPQGMGPGDGEGGGPSFMPGPHSGYPPHDGQPGGDGPPLQGQGQGPMQRDGGPRPYFDGPPPEFQGQGPHPFHNMPPHFHPHMGPPPGPGGFNGPPPGSFMNRDPRDGPRVIRDHPIWTWRVEICREMKHKKNCEFGEYCKYAHNEDDRDFADHARRIFKQCGDLPEIFLYTFYPRLVDQGMIPPDAKRPRPPLGKRRFVRLPPPAPGFFDGGAPPPFGFPPPHGPPGVFDERMGPPPGGFFPPHGPGGPPMGPGMGPPPDQQWGEGPHQMRPGEGPGPGPFPGPEGPGPFPGGAFPPGETGGVVTPGPGGAGSVRSTERAMQESAGLGAFRGVSGGLEREDTAMGVEGDGDPEADAKALDAWLDGLYEDEEEGEGEGEGEGKAEGDDAEEGKVPKNLSQGEKKETETGGSSFPKAAGALNGGSLLGPSDFSKVKSSNEKRILHSLQALLSAACPHSQPLPPQIENGGVARFDPGRR
uniref:C3H1-type domain-containing protein n=1 Tax=Chromera velia CCMP2878 TaxID=1169474 RepID=A0A0G4FR12_9ALVE|eukprot:Cvel_432.t1-p1 / transcript=Cvel_432.t1 / gene=Cvel_432 / organism=Chromera_velia_CCMP2878 / gene_product=hypothetical protein / transcript_product=hypothetical protein / location=Cvel_scaffold14:9150-15298(+) / protein_length=1181 / sequence_SO=supercontig / SO=protein_coding / is_pseudo=false